MCVLSGARGDETIFFSLFSDYRRRFGTLCIQHIYCLLRVYILYYARGMCLCSLFSTIIATRSPITPLVGRIQKRNEQERVQCALLPSSYILQRPVYTVVAAAIVARGLFGTSLSTRNTNVKYY